MAGEDRSASDLILSVGREPARLFHPHGEKRENEVLQGGRVAGWQGGRVAGLCKPRMKKAAHRSLRPRETEAIDVIGACRASGSFDRSAGCRFSSNRETNTPNGPRSPPTKTTGLCPPLYFTLARASKIYGPSVYPRPYYHWQVQQFPTHSRVSRFY